MWTRLGVTVFAVGVAIGASACGGSNSGESSDASAAVIEQVDSICDERRDGLAARGDFPVDNFDPESPSPDDLPAVGDYFATAQPAAQKAIAELRALSPPAGVDDQVDSLISALQAELESADVQTSAAQAGNVSAFVATLDDAASSKEAVKEAADDLGGGASCTF